MPSYFEVSSGSSEAANQALRDILSQISVSMPVLREAKKRRRIVLDAAMRHPAALDESDYGSGSVAHGTQNSPLEDADGGNMIDRRTVEFRAFGPEGRGPTPFVDGMAAFIEPLIRLHYPNVEIDCSGKRAIKVMFHEVVEVEDGVKIDPYVDLMIGLTREEGGIWIPNKELETWDVGDPKWHTWRMTQADEKPLRVHRAQVLRLAKRAVKEDNKTPGRRQVMCSWNLSALAIESITEVHDLGDSLAFFFRYASDSIARSLTADPSKHITEPLKLPEGVTQAEASARLWEMHEIVAEANRQLSENRSRRELARLFGTDMAAILEKDRRELSSGLSASNGLAVAAALGASTAPKPVLSHGS